MRRVPINYEEYTTEELLAMRKTQAVEGLPERAQKFCEAFVEGHNYKTALIKAGYVEPEKRNGNFGRRLLLNKGVQRYVAWLKARALNACLVNAYDLIDMWVRIAFSDMSDFVEIHPTYIKLKPDDMIDGQLIKSIKSGKDGVSIELHDKMKALDNLARYMEDMPKDYKQKLEERKMDLLEQEFELKKKMVELDNPEQEDDGFMKAIKEATKAVWSLGGTKE